MREVNIETVWGRAWTGPVLALLLALDLPLLPWIDHSVAGISRLTPATGMPQPWLGAIALIACADHSRRNEGANCPAPTTPMLIPMRTRQSHIYVLRKNIFRRWNL